MSKCFAAVGSLPMINFNCFIIVNCSVLEIFSWLIEVENVTKENRDNGKIKWSVNYVQDLAKSQQNYSSEVFSAAPEGNGRRQRVIARFQIMKDDIQSILPIAKVFYCAISVAVTSV